MAPVLVHVLDRTGLLGSCEIDRPAHNITYRWLVGLVVSRVIMPKFSFRSKPHPTSLLRDLQLPRGESNRTSLSSTPASIWYVLVNHVYLMTPNPAILGMKFLTRQLTATSILFVPDLCVKEPEALLKSSWAQLAHSFPPDTTCHVLQALGFEYCLEISDAKSVWTAIIKEAKELVERLIKKVESHLVCTCTIKNHSTPRLLFFYSKGGGPTSASTSY